MHNYVIYTYYYGQQTKKDVKGIISTDFLFESDYHPILIKAAFYLMKIHIAFNVYIHNFCCDAIPSSISPPHADDFCVVHDWQSLIDGYIIQSSNTYLCMLQHADER